MRPTLATNPFWRVSASTKPRSSSMYLRRRTPRPARLSSFRPYNAVTLDRRTPPASSPTSGILSDSFIMRSHWFMKFPLYNEGTAFAEKADSLGVTYEASRASSLSSLTLESSKGHNSTGSSLVAVICRQLDIRHHKVLSQVSCCASIMLQIAHGWSSYSRHRAFRTPYRSSCLPLMCS